MTRLAGKKALVTGASQGIGKAIAVKLAEEGCEVIIHFHEKEQDAEDVASTIRQRGGRAHIIQADLRDTSQAVRLGRQAWDMVGQLDILVNNAGVSFKKNFLDASEEDFDLLNGVNFKSTAFLTQAIAQKMVEYSVEGSIWTITSVNAFRPGVGLSLYGATKGALEALMKGIALELGPHHIRVNTLAVGAVQTDMNRAVWENPAMLEQVNQGIPLGRLGQSGEVAFVLADLISSGSYLTGASITLDGGLLLMRGYEKPRPYKSDQ